MKKYNVIYADPPWEYNSPAAIVGNGGKGKTDNIKDIIQVNVKQHYDTMSLNDIKNLPVKQITEKNSFLFLWTTNAFMAEAHEVAKCWGFKPKTIITWGKIKKDDNSSVSMKTGHWFRGATEHMIFATKGSPKKITNDAFPTLYLHPRLLHSQKPDIFYELIEKMANPEYLELFARKTRKGWDCWGNQVKSTFSF